MIYAGEEIKVTVAAKDFDHSTVLTSADVQSVTVTGYNPVGTQIFQQAMNWDGVAKDWVYLWDTTGLAAGSYRLKLLLTDITGKKSWEFKRVRLARNPV